MPGRRIYTSVRSQPMKLGPPATFCLQHPGQLNPNAGDIGMQAFDDYPTRVLDDL